MKISGGVPGGKAQKEAEKEGRPGRRPTWAGEPGREPGQGGRKVRTAYGIQHNSSSVAGRTCPHLCVCALPEGWERKEGRGEGS